MLWLDLRQLKDQARICCWCSAAWQGGQHTAIGFWTVLLMSQAAGLSSAHSQRPPPTLFMRPGSPAVTPGLSCPCRRLSTGRLMRSSVTAGSSAGELMTGWPLGDSSPGSVEGGWWPGTCGGEGVGGEGGRQGVSTQVMEQAKDAGGLHSTKDAQPIHTCTGHKLNTNQHSTAQHITSPGHQPSRPPARPAEEHHLPLSCWAARGPGGAGLAPPAAGWARCCRGHCLGRGLRWGW